MVTQTYNLSPRKVEAGGSLVQGNLGYPSSRSSSYAIWLDYFQTKPSNLMVLQRKLVNDCWANIYQVVM